MEKEGEAPREPAARRNIFLPLWKKRRKGGGGRGGGEEEGLSRQQRTKSLQRVANLWEKGKGGERGGKDGTERSTGGGGILGQGGTKRGGGRERSTMQDRVALVALLFPSLKNKKKRKGGKEETGPTTAST